MTSAAPPAAQVYLAAGSSPAVNRELLERMVDTRAQLARLQVSGPTALGPRLACHRCRSDPLPATPQGFPSYAALRTAGGSLAGQPGAVLAFLADLAERVRPLAERELAVGRGGPVGHRRARLRCRH